MEQRMAVAAVAEAAAGVERAQALLEATVVLAREAGATWAQIGDAAGMSRQSAHERWGCIRAGDARAPTADARTTPLTPAIAGMARDADAAGPSRSDWLNQLRPTGRDGARRSCFRPDVARQAILTYAALGRPKLPVATRWWTRSI